MYYASDIKTFDLDIYCITNRQSNRINHTEIEIKDITDTARPVYPSPTLIKDTGSVASETLLQIKEEDAVCIETFQHRLHIEYTSLS